MKDKKLDFGYTIAKELKKRDNPKDYKPCEAFVVSLSPVVVSILDGKIKLVEGKDLIITEWFKKRWDIDKTAALSVDIPGLLSDAVSLCESATNITETHSYGGAPCQMPNAVSDLSQAIAKVSEAITKNKNELLALKLDLQINDKVFVVSSSMDGVFFLVDKVIDYVPG